MIDFMRAVKEAELDKGRYYLILAGSRGFDFTGSMLYSTSDGQQVEIPNYSIFEGLVDRKVKPVIDRGFEIRIVHGDARGADKLASFYSQNKSYWHKEFTASWDIHGKRAGMIRNESMYTYTSLHSNRGSIVFWDGESKGTRNNFLHAVNYNVPILCYLYLEQRWMTKDEVQEIKDKVVEESRYHYGY